MRIKFSKVSGKRKLQVDFQSIKQLLLEINEIITDQFPSKSIASITDTTIIIDKINIIKLIDKINQLQINPNNNYAEYYQMIRIQNDDTAPANFIILFLVTGQKSKDKTVIETINFIKTLNFVSNE